MTEIDFTKRRNELYSTKERLKRLKESKLFIPIVSAGAVSLIALLTGNKAGKIIGATGTAVSCAGAAYLWHNSKGAYGALTKEVKETVEYQELEAAYEELVNRTCTFIKSLNLKNSLEINTILINMLENGMFSITTPVTHEQNKYMIEVLGNLTGSVVCTGNMVCRHESSFITDILNRLGYTACNIEVDMLTKEELEQIKSISDVKYLHAIVGIIEEGRKYYFDPLHGLFIENYGIMEGSINKANFRNVLKAKGSEVYYIESLVSSILNGQYREELYTFLQSDSRLITDQEMNGLEKSSSEIFVGNLDKFFEFADNNQELYAKIASTLSILAPSSNTEEPAWVLKKDFTKSK